ncbi:MAG: hypothetical protein DI532_12470 [Azospirillum brasilense]|nr:MAG: hypothetical protein DI532_12470 [Azospirillum brasilense]
MTEGDLEARIRGVLRHVFPWLPEAAITHQTTFSFRLGHSTITVGGRPRAGVSARTDVLVQLGDRPLAILELKRPGKGIGVEDEQQGLSYARLLHPGPPLVVVTDGEETVVLETYSGERWAPSTPSEQALRDLVERAAEVARGNLKRAVDTLMGSGADIWTQAVSQATARALADRTGAWQDTHQPFVGGWLVRRKATSRVAAVLRDGSRLVVLRGSPMAGKSSVLRELATGAFGKGAEFPVLFLDADGGLDVFRSLADLLVGALDWPVTPDEAREWLRRMSLSEGPVLVLAIDNLGSDAEGARRDLEVITSHAWGDRVRVVLALDEGVTDSLLVERSGRAASTLGRRADVVGLGPLDGEEFAAAAAELLDHGMHVVHGGHHSRELRFPWFLRLWCADVRTRVSGRTSDGVSHGLPPVAGPEFLQQVRSRFNPDSEPFCTYRELAEAFLEDAGERQGIPELVLEGLHAFVVRQSAVRRHVGEDRVRGLVDAGLIKGSRSCSGHNVFVVRLPELLAVELAELFSRELECRDEDPAAAAEWLAGAASNMLLGDVIAAEALVLGISRGSVSHGILTELLDRPPRPESLLPGSISLLEAPDGTQIRMSHLQDGGLHLSSEALGAGIRVDPEEASDLVMIGDLHPWLILSHLARRRMEVMISGTMQRLDPGLLCELGSCPLPLHRTDTHLPLPTHDIGRDISLVCHRAGIVEPITWSMLAAVAKDAQLGEWLVGRAADTGNPPLLARLNIVLRHLFASPDAAVRTWALEALTRRIVPALREGIAAAVVHD